MKIETIEINNYKAFYDKYKINVAGKNLFIYGENGSGKSSLYYALKDYTTQDFWNVVAKDIQPATKTDIEQCRDLVLNPFSHYNTEKHEFKTELNNAIEAVKTLKYELSSERQIIIELG